MAGGLLIETPLQYITLKSPPHVSRFLVSANNKQAVVKLFAIKAVRSSGVTYAKLRASPPHNLSEVARGARKLATIEVVSTNLVIPAITVETEHN